MFRKKDSTDNLELPTPTVSSVLERDIDATPVAVMERAKDAIEEFSYDFDNEFITAEIKRLTIEKNRLYGIEQEAEARINAKLATLRGEQFLATSYSKFTGEKRRLNPEVLSWRKKEPVTHEHVPVKVPEVGLFSLGSPDLQFMVHGSGWGEWNPSLDPRFSTYYKDIIGQLAPLVGTFAFRSSVAITARFSGIIPADTKEKIREAHLSGAFSEIRLLAETEWAIATVPNPHYADPIVVGLVQGEMWVIDVFDPTPLEDYIAKEFIA